ncbi:MAG TPA: MarR family transcriptional regulator [Armatimonadota bacterium]|jgi:DNA-binding MarR family transcriptional regulator
MRIERNGGFLIAKIHQVSGRVFAQRLKRHGIEAFSPAQGRILFALWQGDGVSIQTLVQRTALRKSTLTTMLDRLEQDGWIIRQPAPHDRRSILIMLTDQHRHWQAQYETISAEMATLFYAGLTAAEIDHFETTLAQVLQNVQQAEAQSVVAG